MEPTFHPRYRLPCVGLPAVIVTESYQLSSWQQTLKAQCPSYSPRGNMTEPTSSGPSQWKPNSWDRCWWGGKRFPQVPAIWGDDGSCFKAHVQVFMEAEGFTRREREMELKDQERGWKTSLRADQQSLFGCGPRNWSSQGLACILLVFIILAPGGNLNNSPGLKCPPFRTCNFFRLVPRILAQTWCCLSVSYLFVIVSPSRNKVKSIVGWVPIPHGSSSLCHTDSVWQLPCSHSIVMGSSTLISPASLMLLQHIT